MARATTISAQFKAIDKMTAPVKRMQRSMGAFSAKTTANLTRVNMKMLAVQRGVNSLGRRIKKGLGQIGMFAGLTALVMVGGNVIKTFADFEQANVVTASVMGKTVEQTKALQKDAMRLGAITAKTATEVVGLQESFARLGFKQGDIINMTEATIAGSVAMRSELSDTAELVGAVVNTFDDLTSTDATKIIDQMTASTQKSALNFEKLQTAVPIVAGAANAAGIPFNKMLALLGKLSDAGIDASMSSTALRNIFIESAKQGKSYDQILSTIVKEQDKLTSSVDKFGKRAAVPATVLAGKLNETLALSEEILNSTGIASVTAGRQLDTLKGSMTLLGSAWQGFILSMENGTGKLGSFLKTVIRTVTEVLNLASGSAKASEELTKQEQHIRMLAEKFIHITKVIKNVVIGYFAFIAAQKVFAAALVINRMVELVRTFLLIKKTLGMATAAQWALNTAQLASPTTWIIIGIMALIAGVILLVKNWDKLKASFLDSKLLVGIKKIWVFILKGIKGVIDALSKIPIIGDKFDSSGIQERIDKINASFDPKIEKNFTSIQGMSPLRPKEDRTEIINPAQVEEKRQQNFAQQFGTLNLNVANRSDKKIDSWMFGDNVKLQTTGN